VKRRLGALDVPAFLDELRATYGAGPAEVGARVLAAVGLVALPKRTVTCNPIGDGPPLKVRDPATPRASATADVELEDLGGPAWTTLRAWGSDGSEASARLNLTLAGNRGSFTCRGAGTSA
jgi:hypothetical protein